MTALREQILTAVAARLASIPGYRFERNPTQAVRVSELPLLALLDGGHPPPALVTGAARYMLGFAVEIVVTGEDLGPALSAGYLAVVQTLLADRTLAGLAADLREGRLSEPEIIIEEGAPPTMAATLDLEVDYWTAEDDPARLAP